MEEPGSVPSDNERDVPDYRRIVERHGRDLYRLTLSIIGHREDAEDLVQETFLIAYRRLESFEGRSSLRTWLIGILLKRIAKRRAFSRLWRWLPLPSREAEVESAPEVQSGADARSEAHFRMDFAKALARLSDKNREAFLLREVSGLSYEEIGEALGIPLGTVESRLHRARSEMAKLLKDYLEE